MTRPSKRTVGPVAFNKQALAALDDLMAGRVTAMNAVYDPTGIGRVSVTTIDGVHDLAFDLSDVDGGDDGDDQGREGPAEG